VTGAPEAPRARVPRAASTFAEATARLFVDPVLSVVFPSLCVHCEKARDLPRRGPLCSGCWQDLPRHQGKVCTCGQPLGASPPCGRCRRGLSPIARGASLGPYEGPLRSVLHALKYGEQTRAAERLAEALAGDPAVCSLRSAGALLVPVPLHPRRRAERGYNQSELLARALSRRLGLGLAPGALVRRKDTAPQTGLSAAARRQNVSGAFAVRRRALVVDRPVILVDDVFTTGATARACALALRAAGAREVRLLTVARVP
jgi:ComF family protein